MSQNGAPLIEVENLNKTYFLGGKEVRALKDVSFTVRPGEFVVVMGSSGSGKSTLLNLLGGIDAPSGGKIFLEGEDLCLMGDTALTLLRRKKIGFIFQFFNLMPNLTAFENVALPRIIEGRHPKKDDPAVLGILAKVGLTGRLQHKPDQLSGGEQQRVAIARALLNDPVLLLADEPTGNLDTANGVEALKLLRASSDEQGHATLMATHDPTALKFCDRVIFLRDGSVQGDEPVDRAAALANDDYIQGAVQRFIG